MSRRPNNRGNNPNNNYNSNESSKMELAYGSSQAHINMSPKHAQGMSPQYSYGMIS